MDAQTWSLSARWSLLIVLAIGLLARYYWAKSDPHVASGDECEYLRLAENLVKSHRYAGLFEGPQVMYPPLFSLLIAACSWFMPTFELAGELVSFGASILLLIGVFALARELYGTRVGLIATLVAACHPALIELSDAIYSESLYLPLVVLGVVFGLWYLGRGRVVNGVLCGACFGAAYLTRPEALAYPLVVVVALLLKAAGTRASLARAAGRAALVVVVTAAVAAPYVVYLSRSTGRFQIEGKSVMNHAISERVGSGMSYAEATLGLGSDLHEDGPFLSPNQWVLAASPRVPALTWLAHWPITAHRNREDFENCLLFMVFGPIGIGFIAIGLFGHAWDTRRLVREFVVIGLLTGYAFVLLGQHHVAFRYMVPFLPFFLIWGAHGVDYTAHWYTLTSRSFTRGAGRSVKLLVAGIGYAGLLLILLVGMHRLTWEEDFHSHALGEADLEDAGRWIAQHAAGPVRVMSNANEVPYYAGATALRFPYGEPDAALGYVRLKHPDFLVLSRQSSILGAYYTDWFQHGIPDPAAQLVHRVGPASDPHALVYAWKPSPS